MPSNKHYGPNSMSTKDREYFMEWYENNKNKIFDMAKEIREYCLSDVKLLKEGCEKLRELFISQTDCDPFSYITIASACMAIYRNKFMPRNEIPVINDIEMDGHSKSSIMWLEHLAKKEKIFIQHARNDREKVIKGYKVDGFCQKMNTVYEFNGCYFHGCPDCFKEYTKNKSGETMKQLYQHYNEEKTGNH